MKQEGLYFFTDIGILSLGFFLFFISFIIIGIRLYGRSKGEFYKSMAKLPFEGEDQR